MRIVEILAPEDVIIRRDGDMQRPGAAQNLVRDAKIPAAWRANYNRAGNRREAGIVLDAIQTLFGNGKDYFAILNDGGRGVRMKHIEAENQHEGTCRS